MKRVLLCFFVLALGRAMAVEPQPFLAGLRQVIEATDFLGSPFSAEEKTALAACVAANDAAAVERAEAVLEAHTLFLVTINPEQRVKVEQASAAAVLDEAGWRQFLVKVVNNAGTTAPLRIVSGEAQRVFEGPSRPGTAAPAPPLETRWLDLQAWDAPPLRPGLSGLETEYRIVALYSRDAGKREARFSFDVGQGSQDLGFRAEASVLFECQPAREVTLRIADENGAPCTASFLIKDRAGRVYPSQIKRLAPDFGFQPQIYRAEGEKLRLPTGEYEITFQRGPESLAEQRRVKIDAETRELRFAVRRWIDPSLSGWWSGDHHIHAAGCAHYVSPTEGVQAVDMARHCQGEDLKIGANLTWGPCFDYQKQFFTGREDAASRYPYLLRYDIEVSGFGSHKSGHLCLLRLRDQMYPGGESSGHWPTLGLNTLRWAKKQGALVGPAHSGWGLQPAAPGERGAVGSGNAGAARVETNELPNYIVPPYNGIGANEYIVDVTHEVPGPDGTLGPAVDFMSMVDTPAPWELNMWYHTLNAGFRTRISGETDFPCIYGERVGLGRSYVKLPGRLSYDDWCEGIRAGRCYVSDGHSHLLDFTAGGRAVGEQGSELRLAQAGTVKLAVRAAALLAAQPNPTIKALPFGQKPYWDIERARIGDTGTVAVEALVNGQSVGRQVLAADGTLRDLSFEVPIERSSWVALRIYPSAHTNPVFIVVGEKPIRASRRSVEWCLQGVDRCWQEKERTYAPAELEEARAAYEHAREVYRQRLAEAGGN